MRLRVNNYLGCRSADIELQPGLTWLVGPNEAGKTSTAGALRSLLTRNANPKKLTATEFEKYRHRGAESGPDFQLDGPDWTLRLKDREIEERGPVPAAIPERLLSMDWSVLLKGSDAVKAWTALLGADPSMDEVREKLRDACSGLVDGEEVVKDLLKRIGASPAGWDAACAVAEDRAKKAKAAWRNVIVKAGDTSVKNWGASQSADWTPPTWTGRCEGLAESEAAKRVTQLDGRVDAARKAAAAREAAGGTPQQIADQIVQCEASIGSAKRQVAEADQIVGSRSLAAQDANSKLAEARSKNKEREKVFKQQADAKQVLAQAEENAKRVESGIPPASAPDPRYEVVCPGCGAKLQVVTRPDHAGNKIGLQELLKPADAERLNNARKRVSQAEASMKLAEALPLPAEVPAGTMQQLEQANYDASNRKSDAIDLRARERARVSQLERDLEGLRKRLESANRADDDAGNLPQLEDQLAQAQADLANVTFRREAAEQDALVRAWLSVVAELRPDGLRKAATDEKVAQFNDTLGRLQARAGWRGNGMTHVTLDPASFRLSIGGADLRFASDSQRWRAGAAAMVALAWLEDSPALILDGAEILIGVKSAADTLQQLGPMLDELGRAGGIAVLACFASFVEIADQCVQMKDGQVVA